MANSRKQRSVHSQLRSRLNRRDKRRLRFEHLETRYLLAGDLDGDGVMDLIEDGGPNGGDGNNDAILDSTQGNVASLPSLVTGNYATLVTNVGTLAGVAAVANPSPGNAPTDVTFSIGFFEFEVQGVTAGGPATVEIISTDPVSFDRFWNYGPTAVTPTNTWYEYTAGFDGRGGTSYAGNSVALTLVDGNTGDDDLAANGVISRVGGPGVAGAPVGTGDRVILSDSIPATVAGNVAVDGIISGTYSSEANFTAEVFSSTTYGFEQPQFPAASAIIGVVNGIDFFGRIGFAANPVPPSGNQFMRGTGATAPYDEEGVITFPQTFLPNAVGFFTGFGAIASPAPFTRVQIVSNLGILLHEEFIPTTGGGGSYFGYINTNSAIQTIKLQGFEADLVTPADNQQFGIDDLTVGFANQGPTTSSVGTPSLLSAARNASGGTNGTRRVHIEWDITDLAQTSIEQAEVLLHTNQGVTDVLDTFFFVATQDGNGTLEETDFETFAQQIDGVVMEVTGVPGQTGTFTFDVTAQLQNAINAGFDYFTVQGRVDELPVDGPFERGLQFSSTLGSNPVSEHPQLNVDYEEPTDPADNDGVSDAVETGAPNQGDGNSDGILDSQQNNVASLTNAATGEYVTVAAAGGLQLSSVSVSQPAPPAAGIELPIGAVSYTLSGLTAGAATVVEIFPQSPLPAGTSYYKFGPEPSNTTPHWYEFLFDGTTGAEFQTNGAGEVTKITLHLVDGARGDNDLTVDGVIVDPGGPSVVNAAPSLTVANATSTTGKGSTATNTGTFDDALGQVVTIESSAGKVSKTEGNSGNWTWQFGPATGSSENQTVTITATDNFGAQSTVQFNLVVNDSLPDVLTIDPNTPLTVAEGATVTVTGTYDTGAGAAPFTGTAVWSDGVTSPVIVNGDGTFSTSRVVDDTGTDADGGLGSVTVTVTIIDANLGSDSITSAPITVTNDPPTISVVGNPDPVDEGAPFTLTLGTVQDTGNDTVTAYSVSWGDGKTDNFTVAVDGTPDGKVITHEYADGPSGPFAIIVSLTDEDGTHTAGSDTLNAVSNVAPAVDLSGDATAFVGFSYSLTIGEVIDPGNDTVSSFDINWGDGSPIETFNQTPVSGEVIPHTYLAVQATAVISISLTDEDGTFTNVDTLTITVNDNFPPNANDDEFSTDEDTAIIAGDVLENDSDPDLGDVLTAEFAGTSSAGVTVTDNGDGTFDYDPSGHFESLAVGESFVDNFIYTISDGNGGTDLAIVTVTIAGLNDAPTAANASLSADEDGPAVTSGVLADDVDSDDDADSLAYMILSGPSEGSATSNGDGTFTFDPGGDFQDLAAGETRVVSFTYKATDRHAADSNTGTVEVTVTGVNDAPDITELTSTSGSETKVGENDRVDVSGSFSDVDTSDSHTATVDWGDGSAVESLDVTDTGQTGTFTSTTGSGHTYADGGIYTVTITLYDGHGGVATETTDVFITGTQLSDGVLLIVGTNDDDLVTINKQGNGTLKVHSNFFPEGNFRTFPLSAVDSIIIIFCDGDDQLNVAGNISTPILADGGAGDDFLIGGDGPDVLIGGTGADDLHGKKGDDALVGGSTEQSGDPAALSAALDTWAANTSYDTRVDGIEGQLTIIDDGHTDELKGDQNRDLFFNGLGDDLQDVANNETVSPEEGEGEGAFGEALSVTISAATISELGTARATLSRIAADLSESLTVFLASGDLSELKVPSSVTIPAGSDTITIELSGVDDGMIDGSQVASLIAKAPGVVTAVAKLLVGEGNFPFQNAINALDVDEDGVVAPKDALLVINELIRNGSRALVDGESIWKIDVSGDNIASPIDVVRIFNYLNGPVARAAVGEAGPASAALRTSSAESSSREDGDVPGGFVGFVVTTDLTGTTVESDSDADPLSADDPELAATAYDPQSPPTTPASSSDATTQVDTLDTDELGSELDELAEDVAGLQDMTAHELLFGRFV